MRHENWNRYYVQIFSDAPIESGFWKAFHRRNWCFSTFTNIIQLFCMCWNKMCIFFLLVIIAAIKVNNVVAPHPNRLATFLSDVAVIFPLPCYWKSCLSFYFILLFTRAKKCIHKKPRQHCTVSSWSAFVFVSVAYKLSSVFAWFPTFYAASYNKETLDHITQVESRPPEKRKRGRGRKCECEKYRIFKKMHCKCYATHNIYI